MKDAAKNLPAFDLSRFLPYRLNRAAARVSRAFARRYRAEFGISIPEWRVLAHLHAAPEPLSIRDIEARVDLEKSTVSRAVARLVKLGFVKRTPHATDRRLLALSLTAEGHALMQRIIPVALAFQEELLLQLGDRASALEAALDRLEEDSEG